MSNKEGDKMPTTAVKTIKPIRPTKAVFDKDQAQRFDNYASQAKKTESVGMNRMREMMKDFKEKRK